MDCAASSQIFIYPPLKSNCTPRPLSLSSPCPFLTARGGRWTHVAPKGPSGTERPLRIWSPPPAFWSSRRWPPRATPPPAPPVSVHRCQADVDVRRGPLCVDSNYIPVDLCSGTDHRHAAPLVLLLAVCYTSVIPKQALSVQCLLIHSPRGVEAQAAALTVNVFPKIPVAASLSPPHMTARAHIHLYSLGDSCFWLS